MEKEGLPLQNNTKSDIKGKKEKEKRTEKGWDVINELYQTIKKERSKEGRSLYVLSGDPALKCVGHWEMIEYPSGGLGGSLVLILSVLRKILLRWGESKWGHNPDKNRFQRGGASTFQKKKTFRHWEDEGTAGRRGESLWTYLG